MLTREEIDALPEGDRAKYVFGSRSWRTYIYQSKSAYFKAGPDGRPPDEWEAIRMVDSNPDLVWLKPIDAVPEIPILSEGDPVRTEWRVTFVRSPREIKRVQLQQWNVSAGTPRPSRGITIPLDAIPRLLDLFRVVQELPDNQISHKARFDDEVIAEFFKQVSENEREAQDLIQRYPQLVKALRRTKLDVAALTKLLESGETEASAMIDAVLRNEGGKVAILRRLESAGVTEEDIANLTYRKEQLEVFRRLLTDSHFFDARMRELSLKVDQRERVWQTFFEHNRWVFGYGLKFRWLSGVGGQSLETDLIGGDDLEGAGVRMDAVLRTRGRLASLCFVEIKHHGSALLKQVGKPYRGEAWLPSDDLAGGVAQVQRGVWKALRRPGEQWEDFAGNAPVQPKSILVIGALSEFAASNGVVDKGKYRSFELFRSNVSSPEIITFDELFERCRYIVETGDDRLPVGSGFSPAEQSFEAGVDSDAGDDEIPF
ncbi:Shedu immune nuclease family protein [Corallococcus exiguus]|uniref:Shedu immune nuclease family protein n=1 Tax=Corallococcus exiguus TaxID=83462 RepID=UPI001493E15A|nr:Shedu immune nuclease family protein [Corallococcus exiguus]NPD28170.1 DUF4263 domain-containing protein [Corallococcus exiguus]